MSVVKSVEYLEVDMSTDTLSQTDLTKGQDEAACTPFLTIRATANLTDEYDKQLIDVFFDDNAGTARLNLQRKTAEAGLTVQIFVIEWDTTLVNVQQGTITLGDTESTSTATITAVTLAKAFVTHTMREGTTQSADPNGADDYFTEIKFNSTTQLGIAREHVLASGLGDLTGHYYVVECIGTEFSVKTASPTLASTAVSASATISAVTVAKTFLVSSFMPGEGGPGLRDFGLMAHLSSTAGVNISRDGGGGISGTFDQTTIFAVECSGTEWSVEHFQPSLGTGETQDDTTITAVDTDNSVIIMGTYANMSGGHVDNTLGTVRDNQYIGLDLTTTTNVRARRKDTDSLESFYKFGVVDFDIGVAAAFPIGGLMQRGMGR